MKMPNTSHLKSFIPEEKIWELLKKHENPSEELVESVLVKTRKHKRLELEDMAILIQNKFKDLDNKMFKIAEDMKEDTYGNRIVLFAPLYVGNKCINDCIYCGFRVSNKDCIRSTLSIEELENETKALVSNGHKRLIMVYGEHPNYDANYIASTVKKVYETKVGKGEIRRVNINAAPLEVEDYTILKNIGIGTFQIFQETYHRETYEKLHPGGPKSDYLWRLYGLDRAMEGGIDDLGIGALFGLFDWKFETMALLAHTIHLEEKYGVGPHTISFPRIEPAYGSNYTEAPPYQVSDKDFKRIIAILRLSVPYTGMILTARESVEVRNECLPLGCSQIDAGSSIGIGEYSSKDEEVFKKTQFQLGDNRPLDQVVRELAENGFIPSWCTACYRLGRTGEHFMEYSKPGDIKSFCQPNAILTFLEYLIDYASPQTQEIGYKMLPKEVEKLKTSYEFKKNLLEKIESIKNGKRDLYF